MDFIQAAAQWAGWPLDPMRSERLVQFGAWLATEAVAGGGLGPNEVERIADRHLADSLLFAAGWQQTSAPTSLIDLGSGVGLPGIPLAILWPQTEVVLVDRSTRKVELARRAGRILGLSNVSVVAGDASRLDLTADMVVARAVADPEMVAQWARRVVGAAGVVVLGGSHRAAPPPATGQRIVEVPPQVLDRPVWLRMMAPT